MDVHKFVRFELVHIHIQEYIITRGIRDCPDFFVYMLGTLVERGETPAGPAYLKLPRPGR